MDLPTAARGLQAHALPRREPQGLAVQDLDPGQQARRGLARRGERLLEELDASAPGVANQRERRGNAYSQVLA